MKTFRIQPEVINVNGKIVTILNGEVSNMIDLTDREVFALRRFFKSENESYNDIVKKMVLKAAKFYEIPPESVYLKSRKRRIIFARQYSCWLIRDCTKMSYAAIGKEFEQNHATVMHSVKEVNKRIETNQLLFMRDRQVVKYEMVITCTNVNTNKQKKFRTVKAAAKNLGINLDYLYLKINTDSTIKGYQFSKRIVKKVVTEKF